MYYLYSGDDTYRFKQEIVLGIGGVRLLQALGFTVWHCHLDGVLNKRRRYGD